MLTLNTNIQIKCKLVTNTSKLSVATLCTINNDVIFHDFKFNQQVYEHSKVYLKIYLNITGNVVSAIQDLEHNLIIYMLKHANKNTVTYYYITLHVLTKNAYKKNELITALKPLKDYNYLVFTIKKIELTAYVKLVKKRKHQIYITKNTEILLTSK